MGIRALVRHSLRSASAAFSPAAVPASAQPPAALTGRVTSAAEGAMEGVLVSLKREGSNKTVTVVSHADGSYSFPRDRLEPGRYAVSTRAVKYVLAERDTQRRDRRGRDGEARPHAARQQSARARAADHGPRVVRELSARRPHEVGAVPRLQPLPHDAPAVDVDLRRRGARVGHAAHGLFGRQLADALSTAGQRDAALGPRRRRRAVGLAKAPSRGRRRRSTCTTACGATS